MGDRVSSKYKQFRLREARPLAPADCLHTRHPGACAKCGQHVDRLHTAIRAVTGTWCSSCCPCCSAGTAGAREANGARA